MEEIMLLSISTVMYSPLMDKSPQFIGITVRRPCC